MAIDQYHLSAASTLALNDNSNSVGSSNGTSARWLSMGKFVRMTGSAAVALILCAACATQFEAADATRIHKIRLSGFTEPTYQALFFVLLNAAPVKPEGYDEFSVLMARQNLHLGAELKAAVTQALRNDGYEVVEDGSTSADAVLDLQIRGWEP